MNSKLIGAVCLVSGTAIGAGMIALPIALAKFGLLPTVLMMLVTWAIMYYSALVGAELNLRAGKGLPLPLLGKLYSGTFAQYLGGLSLKLLSYALFSAYLYACASASQSLTNCFLGKVWVLSPLVFGFAVIFLLLFCLPIRLIDYCNRVLFFVLVGCLMITIGSFFRHVHFLELPLLENQWQVLSGYSVAIPIVFTSFGFQMVLHTLVDYCDNDPVALKRAFFWGSFIPVVVYSLWTLGTLGIVRAHDKPLYERLLHGNVDVGEFIRSITQITQCDFIPVLLSIINILAILTSAIGVGMGLIGSWKEIMGNKALGKADSTLLPVLITLLPALLVALFIPGAFLRALSFAGMISVVGALFLPLYLLKCSQSKHTEYHYPVLGKKRFRLITWALGAAVILCEAWNLI